MRIFQNESLSLTYLWPDRATECNTLEGWRRGAPGGIPGVYSMRQMPRELTAEEVAAWSVIHGNPHKAAIRSLMDNGPRRMSSIWVHPDVPVEPFTLICEGCDEPVTVTSWYSVHAVDCVIALGDGSYTIRCEDCARGDLNTCYRCDDTWHVDDLQYHNWRGVHVCAGCFEAENDDQLDAEREQEEEEEDTRVIRSYHSSRFKPYVTPWAESHGGRMFGVELEVEVGGRDKEDAAETLYHVANADLRHAIPGILKTFVAPGPLMSFENDGSLDDGFEMISAPMGLDGHRVFWPTLLKSENRRGLSSHNTETCGLHVHMSRTGLTTTQLGKMVVFLNHPDNERLIRAIARRYRTEYCKIKSKTLEDYESTDRYEALNLTNAKTVEFRIFRGSLNADAVLAAVEFAHAVAEFCREDAPHGMTFSTDAFLSFIRNDPDVRKDTQTLRKYLNARGLSV